MWVPSQVVDWFHISRDAVEALREDNSALRAERDSLKSQLLATQTNFNWLTTRINALEVERAQLIEKAYGIKIPVPEIVRTPSQHELVNPFSFEDMGDDMAKKLGFPIYNS